MATASGSRSATIPEICARTGMAEPRVTKSLERSRKKKRVKQHGKEVGSSNSAVRLEEGVTEQ
jgi:hypothetical protein